MIDYKEEQLKLIDMLKDMIINNECTLKMMPIEYNANECNINSTLIENSPLTFIDTIRREYKFDFSVLFTDVTKLERIGSYYNEINFNK